MLKSTYNSDTNSVPTNELATESRYWKQLKSKETAAEQLNSILIGWTQAAKAILGDCFISELFRFIKPGSVQLQLTQLKMSTGKTGVQRGRHKFTNSDMK